MSFQSKDDRCFSVNAPKVACQIIEGEALLIHFERGHYYSATGSAAFLLELVDRGLGEHSLCSALARRFDLETELARNVVSAFVDQLLGDELFVVVDTARQTTVAPASPELASDASAGAFEEPRLFKYTDLQDLLVLDPVHDVMMTGWLGPAVPAAS